MQARKGFTLIELLIYSAVFATFSLTLVYFLTTFFRVSGYQASSAGVANQANFILQKLQQQIASASFIVVNNADTCASVTDTNCDETDATLNQPHSRLVMKDRGETTAGTTDDKSPIIISRDAATSNVMMKIGNQATTILNNANIAVTKLTFTKVSTPPGKDVILIDLVLRYLGGSTASQISREFVTGVGKASAATFDTPLTITGDANITGSANITGDVVIGGKATWTQASPDHNSISFLKMNTINIGDVTGPTGASTAGYELYVTVSSSTIPTIAHTLAGVLAGDKIFLTPSPGPGIKLEYRGATTGSDRFFIRFWSTIAAGAVYPGGGWSYLIIR